MGNLILFVEHSQTPLAGTGVLIDVEAPRQHFQWLLKTTLAGTSHAQRLSHPNVCCSTINLSQN